MKAFRLLILAGLLAGMAAPAAAQRLVRGTVRGGPDGAPIAEAQVRLRGGVTTVRTSAAGSFSLQIPAGAVELLVITHPEYDAKEVDLEGRSEVDVTLTPKVRYNQYGVPVDRKPVSGEDRDGILVFESEDGQYRFWFDLRVQVDGTTFYGDTYSPIGSGVEVRRARAAFKSQFATHWYGELDVDFADSRADLKDAYLEYAPSEQTAFRIGNAKEIFSLEQNTTSRYLTFLERPMITRLFAPSRHLGAQFQTSQKALFLGAGLHFQDVSGWEEVQTRKDNNQAFGANEGYSLTGKAVLRPFYAKSDQGLHLGAAASFRTPKTTDVIDAVRYSTRDISNINRRKYLDTDQIPDVHHTTLTQLEGAAWYHGLRLQGEYTGARVSRREDAGVEHFSGWYVFGSTMLFGGKYRYNAADAEFTQPSLGRGWGDLELAVRYEYVDLNSNKATVMGGQGEGLTIGLNYYPVNNVKFMVNYGYVNHDRWANGRGRLPTGLDASGTPTRDPTLVVTPAGEAGEDYSMLMFRMQVSF